MKENQEAMNKYTFMFRTIAVILAALNIYWFCLEHNDCEGGGYASVMREIWLTLLRGLDDGLFLLHSPYCTIVPSLLFFLFAGMMDKAQQEQEKVIFGIKYVPTHELGMKVGLAGLGLSLVCPVALFVPVVLIRTVIYTVLFASGIFGFVTGIAIYTSTISKGISRDDPYNKKEESAFPQVEYLVENDRSINLKTKYYYLGELHHGVINIQNPYRATMILGGPGCGKSFSLVNPIIRQTLAKGYTMFLYDFKIPTLTTIAYSHFMWHKSEWAELYGAEPHYYCIDFDNPRLSSRCNPLDPRLINDMSDVQEIASTICVNLARTWADKEGDFFVESAKNYLAAVIWFLKKYKDGKYCTFPHVIDFIGRPMEDTIPILSTQRDLVNVMAPFLNAWSSGATNQIQGQIASVQIPLGRIADERLYWTLSGNDFTLDINNPKSPKVVCVGNNPTKSKIYGTALGLISGRVTKLINQQGKLKCAFIVDELPTIFLLGLDELVNTARSNKVAVVLCFQDFSQLEADYKKANADKIIKTVGNFFCGQVYDQTAELVSKRLGKNMQQKASVSMSDSGVSTSISTQMDFKVPEYKISQLSNGHFVGIVCDDHGHESEDKVVHCTIDIDLDEVKEEEANYLPRPEFYSFDDGVVNDKLRALAQKHGVCTDGIADGTDGVGDLIEAVRSFSKEKGKPEIAEEMERIRDERMAYYIDTNRNRIMDEAVQIAADCIEDIKRRAEEGDPQCKRIWALRQKAIGEDDEDNEDGGGE